MLRRLKSESVVAAAIAALVPVVLLAYFVNFWGVPISSAADKWGQFGDYVGGVLNPMVALGALLLLVRSIRLQKEELGAARAVMHDQAQSAQLSARLTGYSSMINSALAQIDLLHRRVEHLSSQIRNRPDSRVIYDVDGQAIALDVARATIDNVNGQIHELAQEHLYYKAEMRLLLI